MLTNQCSTQNPLVETLIKQLLTYHPDYRIVMDLVEKGRVCVGKETGRIIYICENHTVYSRDSQRTHVVVFHNVVTPIKPFQDFLDCLGVMYSLDSPNSGLEAKTEFRVDRIFRIVEQYCLERPF